MSVQQISENFSITGQITAANVEVIAQMGFKSIICCRPDGEGMMQPAFADIEAAAKTAGITAKYLPVPPTAPQLGDAQKMATILGEVEGPVLGYCASGARAANLWNLCQSANLTKTAA